MNDLILDASVTVDWLLDDEFDPRARAALALVRQQGAVVPVHWHLEVRNSLIMAYRRDRIPQSELDARLLSLKELPLRTDTQLDLDVAVDLAREHTLTMYDAVYLELAQRRQATLATLDAALGRAATAEGLMLVE